MQQTEKKGAEHGFWSCKLELFHYELAPRLVDDIRRATNGNFALGNKRFAAQVSSVLGRRATPGKFGRPRKAPELEPESESESGNLFQM